MSIITVASTKGGVGKSTFIINLASIFLMNDKKIAILDADIQNSVGKWNRIREYMIAEHNAKPDVEKKEFFPVNVKAYKYYKSKRKTVSDYFKLQSEYKRLTLNNPIQTRGSHQMKLALCYIFEWIVENDLMWIVKMCNAVHDETVCEAPLELAEEVKEKVGQFMRKAGDYYLENLNIKADANIGQTWYEAK